ncbi:MAG TPA: PDZ domain-containing protein, partial [Candidatus Scatomorpha merdipullorum]|nr:PDZ domain-containing protein [Candidatus Scatomorpha merdipullorum]
SGAEAVGVRRGDIVVSADGEHVSEIGDLAAVIDRKEIGQTVSLELYRDGEMVYVDVELSESA